MKIIWSIILMGLTLVTQAQKNISPKLKAMLDAEHAFANLSKEKTTKKAFLAYLSDSSVMFDQLKPVKGKKSWEDRKEGNELLYWWPVFAGVSGDGKLGFSTGPWTFAPDKKSDPVAFGYFATVWKKHDDGSWKMAADIGISLPEKESSTPSLTTSNCEEPRKEKEKSSADARKDLWNKALAYDSKLNAGTVSALLEHYTPDARLLRENQRPFQVNDFKDRQEAQYNFNTTGMGISESNDLAYTYGTAKSSLPDSGRQVHHYFMKVWKFENNEWKIILDVLGGE